MSQIMEPAPFAVVKSYTRCGTMRAQGRGSFLRRSWITSRDLLPFKYAASNYERSFPFVDSGISKAASSPLSETSSIEWLRPPPSTLLGSTVLPHGGSAFFPFLERWQVRVERLWARWGKISIGRVKSGKEFSVKEPRSRKGVGIGAGEL